MRVAELKNLQLEEGKSVDVTILGKVVRVNKIDNTVLIDDGSAPIEIFSERLYEPSTCVKARLRISRVNGELMVMPLFVTQISDCEIHRISDEILETVLNGSEKVI